MIAPQEPHIEPAEHATPQDVAAEFQLAPPSRVAYLKHRGSLYPIEAVTDPEIASLSEDPFVQGFAEHPAIADNRTDRPMIADLDARESSGLPSATELAFPEEWSSSEVMLKDR